jgi:hypothetical protein
MRRRYSWDSIIRSMLLIKIGQDLGTNNEFTRAIHHFIEIINNVLNSIV